MEFTISGRVRRRGLGYLAVALAGCVALGVWLALSDGDSTAGPAVAAAAIALCAWRGARELRRARQPFRLRVDEFGLTLHDAELSWEQIDAVALRYTSAGGDESAPPKPRLTVWTAPGVSLPRRKPDRTPDLLGVLGRLAAARAEGSGPRRLGEGRPEALGAAYGPRDAGGGPQDAGPRTYSADDSRPPGVTGGAYGTGDGSAGPRDPGPYRSAEGRRRYTLLDTDDLDQGLGELTAALAAYGGARFETAPRSVRTPTPVTVAGPERRVPGGERVFRESGRFYRLMAVFCGLVLLGALIPMAFAAAGRVTGTGLVLLGPDVLLAGLAGCACAGSHRRSRRPRELRVGPEGISARERGDQPVRFAWAEVAALTVGPRPGSSDGRPWLLVWPLPGTTLPARPTPQLSDGHLTVPLIALAAIPGGAEAALPQVIGFAGERFSG